MNIFRKRLNNLVNGCKDNDRKAQAELYRQYHADMLRVCLNYLPDDALAQEAVNAGFLKVFQSIRNFDADKGELGGWIRKIMIYTAIDLFRQELKFERIDDQPQDSDDFFIPPEAMERLQFADLLLQIRKLPYATQTVFNLSVIDGFSHKEISEQLNISEGTSRWHLAEAKSKLRVGLTEPNQNTAKPKERSSK